MKIKIIKTFTMEFCDDYGKEDALEDAMKEFKNIDWKEDADLEIRVIEDDTNY